MWRHKGTKGNCAVWRWGTWMMSYGIYRADENNPWAHVFYIRDFTRLKQHENQKSTCFLGEFCENCSFAGSLHFQIFSINCKSCACQWKSSMNSRLFCDKSRKYQPRLFGGLRPTKARFSTTRHRAPNQLPTVPFSSFFFSWQFLKLYNTMWCAMFYTNIP